MSTISIVPVSFQHQVVTVDQEVAIVVATAPGPKGESSAVLNIYTAGASLSGHRMVTLNSSQQLIYATNINLDHAEKVLGMTMGAAAAGDLTQVIRSGELSEPSWNWTLGQPIFLGLDGLLTQVPPASGFLLHVAFPISATRVFVDIKQALIL